MEMGTTISVVDFLNETLKTLESKEFLSKYGCKSQIDELLVTVPKVRALFLQAGKAQSLSEEHRSSIMELKDAVFEANRVLEDIAIPARRIQLLKDRGSLFKKVRLYCSRLNPHWVAYCVSQELTKIRNKFDARDLFISTADIALQPNIRREETCPQPIRREETCSSYVSEKDIIGREDKVENIVGVLLDTSSIQCDPSFLSIVGMGGLGKTALAQLVFNHPRVKTSFLLRLWTCIGDTFDIDEILVKILQSITCRNREGSTKDQVQSQLREKLAGNRYLLVLDDVWTQNHSQWNDLVKYLVGGEKGSWIVVTTRSKTTATMVGGAVYELQALSKDNSWQLFERMAFTPDQLSKPLDDELVKIGRNIVDKCAGVPLSIRVIGSILCGQDRVRWQQFQEIGLANIKESNDGIMSVLKLSFQMLDSSLQSCFSYCALFPKGFEIEKEKLKCLWMAQGYIVPSYKSQSIEDTCENFFLNLLTRCFFQDVKKDKYGRIVSCKMHDLMHDICQHAAGKEMCVMKTICHDLDNKYVRHLSVEGKFDDYPLGKTDILSYLHLSNDGFQVGKVNKFYLESLVANCPYLKALDLSGLTFKSLPDSISKLLHLRYLDISDNTEMEFLPKSIELHNLQTLIIRRCLTLKELPNDLSRLANLRLLDIRNCPRLTCMPSSMGKLTCLHSLSDYIVGGEQSYSSPSQWFDGLNELKPLNNLRGCLNIQIRWPKHVKNVVKEDGEQDGLWLGNKEHLIAISFDFIHEKEADGRASNEEAKRLMEKLHPHQNLKFLEVKKYHGLRMPGWVTLLPNLVELCLTDCRELEYLPCHGNLLGLKVLKLIKLAKLEWIRNDRPSSIEGFLLHLPSLEKIEMSNLPKLKGWRRRVGDDHQFLNDGSNNSSNKAQLQLLPCFSDLKSLFIWNCPELTCFPPCPNMEDLTLLNFNSRLQMILNFERGENLGDVAIPFESSSSWSPHPEISTAVKKVTISNVSWLSSVPKEAFRFLESLDICGDKELWSLSEATNAFCGCSSSLRHLIIRNCCTLSTVVPGGLEHLMALEMLEIRDCNNLRLSEEQQEEGVECTDINTSLMPRLTTLTLHGLPLLVSLPNWMQFLPTLQSLEISFCNRLRSMPNWMRNLQSLTHLTVSGCSKSLKRRCQGDLQGMDWPHIQHIQNIDFQECFY